MTRNQVQNAIDYARRRAEEELRAKIAHHRSHDRKPPTDRTVRVYSTGFDDGFRRALAILEETFR